MISKNTLTICSVFHSSNTARILSINGELTRRINPESTYTWLVADNSLGVAAQHLAEGYFSVSVGVEKPSKIASEFAGSYHHAAALNNLLPRVTTRFLLVLDSDFFIIRHGWIEDVLAHMKKENLAFFGAPYHPRFFNKYRYFPSIPCFFVDLEKISRETLDFTPKFDEQRVHRVPAREVEVEDDGAIGLKNRVRAYFPKSIIRIAAIARLKDRIQIGASRDVGYRVFEKYANNLSFRSNYVQPVFDEQEDFIGPRYARSFANRLFEKVLPDQKCFYPKKKNYYTSQGFYEKQISDPEWWEEYMWRGEPFGLHMRGEMNRIKRDWRAETESIQKIIFSHT